MHLKLIITLLFIFIYSGMLLTMSCKSLLGENVNNPAASTNQIIPTDTGFEDEAGHYDFKFPGFAEKYGPPSWWNGEVFQLSQDYPKNYAEFISAECPAAECTWKKDENNFWLRSERNYGETENNYLKEVIKYAFAGNLEVDWIAQKNTQGRKWYHAPFMHLDIVDPLTKEIKEKVAREFIHGLTLERPGCISELIYEAGNEDCVYPPTNPDSNFQSWAVSLYNERGASYIGKVWDEMLNPKSGPPDPKNFPAQGFPEGTVGIKLLFTQAPPDKVNYLAGSIEWYADTADFIRDEHRGAKRVKEKEAMGEFCGEDLDKCFTKLRLLQIDVAVRDNNSPVGWVFATFTYDRSAEPFIEYESEEKDKNNPWLRIKPLGLMFGNDPGVQKGGDLRESLLNTAPGIPQHYGCGSESEPLKRRLNGPVDNPKSSCIACHSQSETPKDLNIGDVNYPEMRCKDESHIAYWFKNINPRNQEQPTFTTSTRDKQMYSLDYSLQLREGLRRFCVESYHGGTNKCGWGFQKGMKFTAVTKEGNKTFTIR